MKLLLIFVGLSNLLLLILSFLDKKWKKFQKVAEGKFRFSLQGTSLKNPWVHSVNTIFLEGQKEIRIAYCDKEVSALKPGQYIKVFKNGYGEFRFETVE